MNIVSKPMYLLETRVGQKVIVPVLTQLPCYPVDPEVYWRCYLDWAQVVPLYVAEVAAAAVGQAAPGMAYDSVAVDLGQEAHGSCLLNTHTQDKLVLFFPNFQKY